MKHYTLNIAALALAMSALSSHAIQITGAGATTDYAGLSNATVIDFENIYRSNSTSLSIGGVTFSADGLIEVDNDYAGSYNTRGNYHITNHGNGPNAFRFDFSTPTDAFAFLWGAADFNWTLQAFGASGLLDSMVVTPTGGSNSGNYFGLAASGIQYATLTLSNYDDYVFIDNFTFNESQITSVPEPGSMALLAMGVVGFAAARRRQKRS